MAHQDMFRLDWRVALAVGGGGAIGSAMAMAFAGAGARVVVDSVPDARWLDELSLGRDTHTGLNIDFPEPKGSAAQELDDLMKQMDDPRLTDAERSDLTVRMVEAQQRMLEEMMNADPAAAQKKTDEFGCRMVQLDPGPDGAVAGGIVCGKNFASGGGLQVTGTMTQVR